MDHSQLAHLLHENDIVHKSKHTYKHTYTMHTCIHTQPGAPSDSEGERLTVFPVPVPTREGKGKNALKFAE